MQTPEILFIVSPPLSDVTIFCLILKASTIALDLPGYSELILYMLDQGLGYTHTHTHTQGIGLPSSAHFSKFSFAQIATLVSKFF